MNEFAGPIRVPIEIDQLRLESAFGSDAAYLEFVSEAKVYLHQMDSRLVMYGSFVHGKPRPDSDIDLLLCDYFSFRNVPKKEVIDSPTIVCPDLCGQISYPITYADGRIKEYVKRKFERLYRQVKSIQQITGRRFDLNFCCNFQSWLTTMNDPYWELARR